MEGQEPLPPEFATLYEWSLNGYHPALATSITSALALVGRITGKEIDREWLSGGPPPQGLLVAGVGAQGHAQAGIGQDGEQDGELLGRLGGQQVLGVLHDEGGDVGVAQAVGERVPVAAEATGQAQPGAGPVIWARRLY